MRTLTRTEIERSGAGHKKRPMDKPAEEMIKDRYAISICCKVMEDMLRDDTAGPIEVFNRYNTTYHHGELLLDLRCSCDCRSTVAWTRYCWYCGTKIKVRKLGDD